MFVFRVNLDKYIRTQGSVRKIWWRKEMLSQGHEVSRAFYDGCSELTNCIWRLSAERKRLMQARALVTSPCFWYAWTMMIKFPVAAVLDGSTAWYHHIPFRNVVSCSLHPKLNQWQTQVKLLLWYQPSELSVSITLSHRFNLSVGWTASRIHRKARPWISTIIDRQILWQSGWHQPSPRYWRETQEEYGGRAASQIDKQIVSWMSHA